MSTTLLREQLHQAVERLPDELLQEMADFMAFALQRRQQAGLYLDWDDKQWQAFSLEQFLRETDDNIEYSLTDAEEIYHP
jgi:hypothetical protein